MAKLSFGEHSKFTANPAEPDRVRRFYTQVLGCPATKESEKIDIFRIGTNFPLSVVYDDSALSAVDGLKSIWLELRTPEREALKTRILELESNRSRSGTRNTSISKLRVDRSFV